MNFDVHVCLENPDGKATDASEKEAVVEVNLEYEWASQDDSREVKLFWSVLKGCHAEIAIL